MKLTIDTEARTLVHEQGGTARTLDLYAPEAHALLAEQAMLVGWNLRYSYGFSWLGRPIIQLPEDMVRLQEAIHAVRPDVIVETGVAHGGSLVFSASLCRAMGRGRVIGIDVEIRPANRAAIEAHPLADLITLVEGSSTDPAVVAGVAGAIRPGEVVLVILDSDHSYRHVAAELEAYHGLVTPGSYLVATDGVMRDLAATPGGRPGWTTDNPASAAEAFAAAHPEFELATPPRPFDESRVPATPTYWPSAWLRRREA
jgi:cephalosporin hydroxylase